MLFLADKRYPTLLLTYFHHFLIFPARWQHRAHQTSAHQASGASCRVKLLNINCRNLMQFEWHWSHLALTILLTHNCHNCITGKLWLGYALAWLLHWSASSSAIRVVVGRGAQGIITFGLVIQSWQGIDKLSTHLDEVETISRESPACYLVCLVCSSTLTFTAN